jgi:23S rRNA (adenine2503-C2)-methyltransferase
MPVLQRLSWYRPKPIALKVAGTFHVPAAREPKAGSVLVPPTDKTSAFVIDPVSSPPRMDHLLDQLDQLPAWIASQAEKAFRAVQVRRWVFAGRAQSTADMTDLPAAFRERLAGRFSLWTTTIVRHEKSTDGTEKLLLQLADGGRIECVLLRDGERRTICVSSQVGCAMGCVFCASGLAGVERSLTTGEIIEQMLRLQRLLPVEERLSHIVMMGMGEPLANLDRVLAALQVASSPDGLGISARRITISTVGLPPAIRRMADEDCRYNLALSLHAPDDELRNQLVPVNSKTGVGPILEAADYYFAKTGRKLTFEYVLLAGINDRPNDARALGKLLAGRTALLNVIPYNPVRGLPWQTPSAAAVRAFREILEAAGIAIQIRDRKGDDINAACGQLRREDAAARALTEDAPAV